MDSILNNLLNELVDEEEFMDEFPENIAELVLNAPINIGMNNVVNNIGNAAVLEGNPNNLFVQQRGDERISIPNFFEEIILQYTDDQFYEHFRMTRDVFEELVAVMEPRAGNVENNIPLRKKILLTIWVLATPDSFRSIADRFGLSKSKAHIIFKEIVTVLANLVPDFVRWPNEHELEEIEETFRTRSQNRFPGIVGAIDGCHIQIKQPPHNSNDYYNRKGTHSVILQGTCDHMGKFLDVLIGRPGRCHDASVFRSSPMHQRLMDANYPLLPPHKHLLGDAAYPLSLNLLTPFRDNGHLNVQQTRYNVTHASCRSIIERAFGLLKVKFRRLYYLDVRSVGMANLIIAASCTLHNFIITHGLVNINDNINFNGNNNDVDADHNNDDEDDDNDHDEDEHAIEKRNRIMNNM